MVASNVGKKTLAFVTHSMSAGGAERVITTLSNGLSARFNVVIITLKAVPPFYPIHPEVKLVHCRQEIPASKSSFQALKTNYGLIKRIIFLLKENKADICIGFLTTSNILSIIAAKYLGIPVIISERNNPYLEDRLVPKFWKILRRLVYPFTDYLVVQTETIKSYYRGKVKDEKLVIIPNPINPDFQRDRKKKRNNVILNVGRLADQKRQDLLIRTFSKLRPSGWKLHIVGEGELRPALESLIDELDLNGQVNLLGSVQNVQEHYETGKIFAFTSKYEGFPNALLEAMYFGMACIATDCPSGPSELIADGINGFLIPVDDYKALEAKLEILITEQKRIEKFGHAAETSVGRFEVKTIISEWEALFSFN